jgi:hypothetical protein
MTSAVPASSYLRVRQTSTTLTITTPGRRPSFAWIGCSFLSWVIFSPIVAYTSHPSLCLLILLLPAYVLLLPFFERSIFQVQPRKWITRQRHIRLALLLKSRSGSGATKYLLGAKVQYSAPIVVFTLGVQHDPQKHFTWCSTSRDSLAGCIPGDWSCHCPDCRYVNFGSANYPIVDIRFIIIWHLQ